MQIFKGQILNRSSVALYVIETTANEGTTGKPPAVVHILAPGRKSPKNIDADGLKRVDGKPIRGHSSWWKIRSYSTAEVFDDGTDLEISAFGETAVKDDEFSAYEMDNSPDWGEPIVDVAAIIKNKKKQTIGYVLKNGERLTLSQALELARNGTLDNVYIFTSPKGNEFLRSKPDSATLNNLRTEQV